MLILNIWWRNRESSKISHRVNSGNFKALLCRGVKSELCRYWGKKKINKGVVDLRELDMSGMQFG